MIPRDYLRIGNHGAAWVADDTGNGCGYAARAQSQLPMDSRKISIKTGIRETTVTQGPTEVFRVLFHFVLLLTG